MKNEDELHHNIVRNIFHQKERPQEKPTGKKVYQGDLRKDPVIGEDVKANFIQVPEVSSVPAVSFHV